MSTHVEKKTSSGGKINKTDIKPDQIPPRDRIVTTASELFRMHGIRGIGVDAIAEAAQTNKMTLYRHFGSKDELICESLRRISCKADGLWKELAEKFPDDPAAQLDGWVEMRSRCLGSEPEGCDLANAAIELKDPDHPAHAVIEKFMIDQRNQLVAACRNAGIEQAESLADTLCLLLEGARVSRQASGEHGPSHQFRQACEAVIASFAKRSPS
jgi:AcrR family transcriptional regulator